MASSLRDLTIYKHPGSDGQWVLWEEMMRAADAERSSVRRETIEECAKAAETYWTRHSTQKVSPKQIANDIRALSDQPHDAGVRE